MVHESELLLSQARAGDQLAFEALLERHAVRLRLYLKRRGGDTVRGDFGVDDLFQVTSVSAWSHLSRFRYRGPGSFHRWLLVHGRGAINDRRKYLRAKDRGKVLNADSWQDRVPHRSPAIGATVSSCLAWKEAADRLDDAIGALPEPHRTVLCSHYLDARSLGAISLALGISKTMVWEHLQQAVARVRTAIAGKG
jgi:RNA polymerase sigma factor (sigma-70 family)